MYGIISKFTFVLLVLALFSNCGNTSGNNDPTSIAKKTIKQNIDLAGMGMLEGLKIESIKMINDNTFEAVHTFSNPLTKRKMRITNKYVLTSKLDSVVNKESIKTEMKSEGEFKEMKGFN